MTVKCDPNAETRVARSGRVLRAFAMLFAAFFVAACSVGGPKPLAPATLTVESVSGVGSDFYGDLIYGADGEPLRLHIWPAQGEEDLIIVAVHGYGDHATSTYEDAAALWAENGATVYAYDQRGFGRNRSRGSWPGPQMLIDDLAQVLETVADRHPRTPLVLVGHSMGGGVSLATVGEGLAPQVDALVLLAPAVWGGEHMPGYLRLATWFATVLAPDMRLTGAGLVNVKPTDNEDLLKQLAADPWFLKYPSPREYMGVIRLMDRARAAAPMLETPVLVMWGAQDMIVPGDAVRTAVDLMPEPKTYVEYPEGWHMLLRDNQGEAVRADVIAWMRDTAVGAEIAEK